MADVFDTSLSRVQAPRGPRPFGREREGQGTSTVGLVTDLFGTVLGGAVDLIESQGIKEVSTAVDEGITKAFDAAFPGEEIGEDITSGIDRLVKARKASKQGRDATDRFNLDLMATVKRLKVNNPGREELINKLLRDRGLLDPRVQLLKEQEVLEDKLNAAQLAREEAGINKAVDLGIATFNENGNPASGVDREATLKSLNQLIEAQATSTRILREQGFFKTPSGETKPTLRPQYIANVPAIRRSVFTLAMLGIRAPLNRVSELIAKGTNKDLKEIKAVIQDVVRAADRFRIEQVENTLSLNDAESENYLKFVDDLLVSLTQGVLELENVKDINQMKAMASVLNNAIVNADLLNAEDLSTLFRIGRLSPKAADTLLSIGLATDVERKAALARTVSRELKTLTDMFPPVRDPKDEDVPKLGSQEEQHSTLDKEDRVQAASDIQQGFISKNILVDTPEDSFAWLASQGPLFNRFIEGTLSENDRNAIANQMLHPNYLANLNKTLSIHPTKAAAVGSYAFDLVQQTLQDTMRQFRNFPSAGQLGLNFSIQFNPQTKQFFVQDENPLGAARRPGAGALVGGKSFADIPGVKQRIDKINKMVPFLVQTREFKEIFKGSTEVDFVADLTTFIQGDVTQFGQAQEIREAPDVKTKQGVTLEDLQPEILSAIDVAAPLFDVLKVPLVITSATEGRHKVGSKHFSGNAIDLRTRQLAPENQKKITNDLKSALGKDFDVIIEKDHIHVEFDPKATRN